MTKLYDGDTFEHDGRTFRINIEDDTDHGTPWENEDGHGPVSDWTRREKTPGERVLSDDNGMKRYYDVQEAMKIARRDGWGLDDAATAALATRLGRTPTRGDIVAESVAQDFDNLRQWCADLWGYVGVIVTHIPDDADSDDIEPDYGHALWGIESDAGDYLGEVAHELAADICHELDSEAAEATIWANRNLITSPAHPAA